MPLTDAKIKNAKPADKQFKLTDGEGMYLLIHPNGSKYWRLKYRFVDKEKVLAFGTYPEISLAEAREKRFIAKKQIKDGIDPSQEKKLAKLTRAISAQNSFEAIAREWHDKQKERLTPRHSSYILKRLEVDIFPTIGFRPISQITPPELPASLQKIEKRGALDIAHRARQSVGQVFNYAIITGRPERNIALDLKGALAARKKENYSRLQEEDLPEFLQKVGEYEGDLLTKLALKFLVLTFVRTGELRGARWDEIKLEIEEWHIPAERMKMRQKHIVPLAKQTMFLLKEIQKISGNREFVFPSKINPSKTISKNTILYRNPLDFGINFFSPNGRRPRIAGSPDIPKQDFVRVSRSFGI